MIARTLARTDGDRSGGGDVSRLHASPAKAGTHGERSKGTGQACCTEPPPLCCERGAGWGMPRPASFASPIAALSPIDSSRRY